MVSVSNLLIQVLVNKGTGHSATCTRPLSFLPTRMERMQAEACGVDLMRSERERVYERRVPATLFFSPRLERMGREAEAWRERDIASRTSAGRRTLLFL